MKVLEQVKNAAHKAEEQRHAEALKADRIKKAKEAEQVKNGTQAAIEEFPKICKELIKTAKTREKSYNVNIYDNTDNGGTKYDYAYAEKMIALLREEGFHVREEYSHYKPSGSDCYYDHDTYSRWLVVSWN